MNHMLIMEIMFIRQISIDAFYFGNEIPTKAVIEVYNEINSDPIYTQNVNIN